MGEAIVSRSPLLWRAMEDQYYATAVGNGPALVMWQDDRGIPDIGCSFGVSQTGQTVLSDIQLTVRGHPRTHLRIVGAENCGVSLYAEHEREDEHVLIEEVEQRGQV